MLQSHTGIATKHVAGRDQLAMAANVRRHFFLSLDHSVDNVIGNVSLSAMHLSINVSLGVAGMLSVLHVICN